jgi:hypothetical protein
MPNPKKKLSETATSLVVILNNVRDLVTRSNRQDAARVMKAFVVYAKNKNYDIPEEKVTTFLESILDRRPNTMISLVNEIAQDIIITDKLRK